MFVEPDIEMPEVQVWIDNMGGIPVHRVDFHWRHRRVIGEVDGRIKYEDGPGTLWEEKLREDDLREEHEDGDSGPSDGGACDQPILGSGVGKSGQRR